MNSPTPIFRMLREGIFKSTPATVRFRRVGGNRAGEHCHELGLM